MFSTIRSKAHESFRYLQKIFRDEQFYVALRHVAGCFIPLIIGEIAGYEAIGLKMMIGGFFVSGVDIAGTFRSKAKALLTTTAISIFITFLLLMTGGSLPLLLPLLFVFIFSLAYISPFSLRYLLMAIMGYIAIIIAVSMLQRGRYDTLKSILQLCFLLLCGSLWYTVYALVLHQFVVTREINRRIAHCIRQTADYFDQRLAMLEEGSSHDEGLIELARLQQQLNDTQESVRELLFSNSSTLSGRSSERRRFYLIFIELVDMHELSMATPVDYPKVRELLHRYPEYNIIRKIIRQTSNEMNNLADMLLNRDTGSASFDIEDDLEQLQKSLQGLKEKALQDDEYDEEVYHTFRQIERYLHRQLQKMTMIRNTVLDRGTYKEQSTPPPADANLSTKDLPQFITPDPLNKNSLLGNLSFESSYFRYALRTAVTAVAGYMLAEFLHFKNTYWVLLTILIVMRPGYGVTRHRFWHRTVGTMAGAVIAFGIYQLGPPHMISLAIFCASMLLGFTFVIHNYAVASSFFTIFVIFLYSFLQREIPSMVIYRVVDTTVGALLVLLAIHYLWPHWEHQKFSRFLQKSLAATKNYLQKVMDHLLENNFNETEYRLARKQAYVKMSNLVSSYYRMRDEPESKQKNIEYSYDLALLTYMLLSAATSLGNFLQQHPDKDGPQNEYRTLGKAILVNIEYSLNQLRPLAYMQRDKDSITKASEVEAAAETLKHELYEFKKQLDRPDQNTDIENPAYRQYIFASYMRRQLSWMIELSRAIAEHAAHPQD